MMMMMMIRLKNSSLEIVGNFSVNDLFFNFLPNPVLKGVE